MVQTNVNMQKLQGVIAKIQTKISRETLAIILTSLSNILFPIAFVYPSQHKFHPILNNLQRGISIVITHIIICKYFGISLDFPSKSDLKYLFIRNTIILFHQIAYSSMYYVVSFPILNTIMLIGPLAVFAIDYLLNGIQTTKLQLYGILLGVAGVLVTINADIILSLFVENHKEQTNYHNYVVEDIYMKAFFSFLFTLGNLVWAYAIIAQKRIKNQPGIKISYFLGLQFICSSALCYSFGGIESVDIEVFLGAMLCSGSIMALCQIMFISALRLTKYTGKLTILMLLYGIPSYCISIFRYGESLNWITVFGFILMGFGLYKCVFNK